MSFFQSLLKKNNNERHSGKALWRYMLDSEDYESLLGQLRVIEPNKLDPRDAALYYSEWWKRNYDGGKPSKEDVFDTLQGSVKDYYNADDFFNLAKKGAHILGIKWIRKQNTLYFRTLLLQGGLPLLHISNNHGLYKKFLLAVLEEQPETIEDFIFKPYIVNILPISSQNDIIYESCFTIVRSILNDDDTYDKLLESSEALKNISGLLRARKKEIRKTKRLSKPKNYWLLNKNKTKIKLRIGLADKYDKESLSNILGFEASEREYKFFWNDQLVCVFKKLISGSYKTDWYQQQNQDWNEDNKLPDVYVIVNDEKREVNDFLQITPDFSEPSLWAEYSSNEWRLIKGNGTSEKKAAVLFPKSWNTDREAEDVTIYNHDLSWLVFEGEIRLDNEDEERTYLSEVSSFDWTIVSEKPKWMRKANLPVVQKKPTVLVYDENNVRLGNGAYEVWIKEHNSNSVWRELSKINQLPLGCLDLKIIKDNLVAFDVFFNIGDIEAKYTNQSIDSATLTLKNINYLEFSLDESPILKIEGKEDHFCFKVKIEDSMVPNCICGSVGFRNKKKLLFELNSPFQGTVIIDKNGRILKNGEKLSLGNLHGFRILSTQGKEVFLKIENSLNNNVKIIKQIKESAQPIISFQDEILRLFYLGDSMDYKNLVNLKLSEGKGTSSYQVSVSRFSHSLDTTYQHENKVVLNHYEHDLERSEENNLELYAIPLNCPSNSILPISLFQEGVIYGIPNTEVANQFVIVSSKVSGAQLLPRFFTNDPEFQGVCKETRIKEYHDELLTTTFADEIWKQVLVYFNVCLNFEIPFSTFDQIRAISRSEKVAARAFFFLGINQAESERFIQSSIPEMEKDLGICFHWINKDDWNEALQEVSGLYDGKYFIEIFALLSNYLEEIGMPELLKVINYDNIDVPRINNADIAEHRAMLGERVLTELPTYAPKVTNEYGIRIQDHLQVKLLLRSPIAVAESINNIQKEVPIWGGDDYRNIIRRNIQYSQYVAGEFYKRTLLYVLNRIDAQLKK